MKNEQTPLDFVSSTVVDLATSQHFIKLQVPKIYAFLHLL
jgi:hypothetical protein